MTDTHEAKAPRGSAEWFGRLTCGTTHREPIGGRGTGEALSGVDVAGAIGMVCAGDPIKSAWADIAILMYAQRATTRAAIVGRVWEVAGDIESGLSRHPARALRARPHLHKAIATLVICQRNLGGKVLTTIAERAKASRMDKTLYAMLESEVISIIDMHCGDIAGQIADRLGR